MFHFELLKDDKEREEYFAAYEEAGRVVSRCLLYFLDAFEVIRELTYKDGKDHHSTFLFLMMSLAESIDGVCALVAHGSAKNCAMLLRPALEAQMGLFYIWETEHDYENRSLAYQIAHLHKRLKWLQRVDPDTDAGKQLRADLKDDPHADAFDVKEIDFKKQAQEIEETLKDAPFAAVEMEWQHTKKANRNKDPHWYSLWRGPKDARALAMHLKMGAAYESLYRFWSEATHAEDALHRLRGKKAGEAILDPLRSPRGLKSICQNACFLCINTTRIAVQKRAQDQWEKYRQKYLQEIRPLVKSLEGLASLDA